MWEFSGLKIKYKREAMGLSRRELARRIGAVDATVRRLEAGKNSAQGDTLAKLAEVLNVSPNYFFIKDGVSSM